jgi:hypothetical protein
MATAQELERAFLNAHRAGDKQAAQALADALRSNMAAQPVESPAAPKERTFGEAAKDIGAGVVSGAGALTQLPGQLYGLATGDFSDTGLTRIGREMRETGEAMKSEELKRREAERAAKIKEAGKEGEISKGVTAFVETIKDPALLSNFIAEQAPNLLPGLAVARGLSLAGAGARTAVAGAVGTGATQQGADIGADTYVQLYKEMVDKGVSETEAAGRALGYARASGASAAVISLAAQLLPGGRAIERAMAKVPIKGGLAARGAAAAKGGAGETISEMIEEGGGKVAQNYFAQKVDPTRSLTEGVGETMGMAAVGGLGLGTAAGLTRRAEAPPPEVKPTEEPTAEPVAQPTQAAPAAPPIPGAPEAAVSEDELRARAEAPPIAEAEFVQGEPLERPPELAQMEQDMETLGKEVKRLERGEPGKSLWSAIKGNLAPSDFSELGDKKFRMLLAPKGTRGVSIADLTASGQLNDWLPEQYHGSPDQLEFGRLEGDELGKAKDAEEYIKDQLRQGNYLTYATNMRLKQIGVELSNIEDAYREYADAETFNTLIQEALDEQRAIYEDLTGAPTEAETGVTEPPARVLEQIPEERVEEEYFPDQEEAKGRLAEKYRNSAENIFNKEEIDKFRKTQYKDRKKLIEMRVDDFLALAEEGEVASKLKNARALVAEGKKFNSLPYLNVDKNGKVEGHEGRHRAKALKEAGYDTMPVVLWSDTIRWSEQNDPDSIDYRKFPDRLKAQNGATDESFSIPFPVSREEANKDYDSQKSYGKLEEQQPLVINKDPEFERIEKELTGKTLLQVSKWAVDTAPNKFAKVIAQKVLNRLNGMASRGIKLEFDIAGGQNRPLMMRGARGVTDYTFGKKGEPGVAEIKITLNGAPVVDNQSGYPPGTRYITVLHELLHAATVGQINVLKSDDPLVKELRDLFNKVVTHFNTEVRAGRLTPFMEKMYAGQINALTGPDELVAWGIADQDMQEFLSEIKVGDKTIMDKLVELIRKILNITKPYLTALDQLVKTTESILDEDVNVVGDKIIAKQYSFGVRPGEQTVQGTLFEQAEKPSPAQKAKAAAQKALQKRTLKRSQFDGVPDDLYTALEPIFAPQNKTIIDKIEGMRDGFWRRLAQGVADQYRRIKDYDETAYIKARMSKTIDGALEGILFNGQVTLTDGALDIRPGTKGLMQVLEPVGDEVDRYQIWAALSRDAELVRQGKKPSVPPAVVARRNELSSGKIGNKSRLEVYQKVQREMKKLNGSVLSIALRQGLIDKEAYKVFRRDINYIPFYKVIEEDGDVQAAATQAGLINQYFSKALEGGERAFGDLMENTLRNWSHILSASMKNEAANATIKVAMNKGAAFPNLRSGLGWMNGKVYAVDRMEKIERVINNDELTESQQKQKINAIMKPYIDAVIERTDISDEMKASLIDGLWEGLADGDGKLRGRYTTSGKGMVKTMINGEATHFDVAKDPLLMESIMSIGYMGPKSKFLDVARDFKNMLQFGVTLSPAFKIRNLIRDSVSAMAVSDLKRNPFANVVQGWASSDRNNPAHISALAGGAIFNFGSYYEGDQAKLIRRLLDKGVPKNTILDTPEKVKKGLLYGWDKYQEWGNKSEAANRIALYNQLREKGLSHLEASFQARDLLDFSMQGSWPAFRFLTQVVPFLNARVQGLYKLWRDGIIPTSRVFYNIVTGKPDESTKSDKIRAEQFSIIMVAVALASLALYMAYKDDEEFKKREQWDRDNFWWFKLPGMEHALRIPKPFELGAFGTIAERVAEQIFDQGVEGKVFKDSLSRMLFDTFAVNLPQIAKPLVDLYANKDSFTGAPIETAGMERLSKAERIAEKTGPLAIALSQTANVFLPESKELSPVQADYAIKAYFGWLGSTASWLSHYAVMPFSKSAYPDNNWTETMSAGFIKTLPATQSKYVTAFYENNKEISQAYADMRHFAQLGQADKVQEILKEKGDKIAMAKFYDNASKDMAKMRQVIIAIRNDQNMTGAQKKEETDRIKVLIGELAKQMEEARIEVKKTYATSQ